MPENPFKIPPPLPQKKNGPPPLSRQETSGVYSRPVELKEDEYLDVDFRDIALEETPEQAKYRRLRHLELVKVSHGFNKRIGKKLEEYWTDGLMSSLDYPTYLQDIAFLQEGEVVDTEHLHGGANGTRLLSLKMPNAKREDPSIKAFEKSIGAEKAQLIDPETGDLLTTWPRLIYQNDGTAIRTTTFDRSRSSRTPSAEKREKVYFKSREMFEEAYQANAATYYGYDAANYPVEKTAFGLRGIEVGKTIRREYVVAALDKLLGLNTVPTTVLYTDGEELCSRQKGIMKTATLDDPKSRSKALIDAVSEKKLHPAKQSLMRLAVLHDLVENTDGHLGNILLDVPNKKSIQRIHGIDFGYALPTHFHNTRKEIMPRDPIKSAAIQLVERDSELVLDDEAMSIMKSVLQEVKDYIAYKQLEKFPDTVSPTEAKRLHASSESIKSGETARLIYDLLAFAYEVDGRPEITQKITRKEFSLFIGRIEHIVETGRPRMPKTDLPLGAFARITDLQPVAVGRLKPLLGNETMPVAPDDGIDFLEA